MKKINLSLSLSIAKPSRLPCPAIVKSGDTFPHPRIPIEFPARLLSNLWTFPFLRGTQPPRRIQSANLRFANFHSAGLQSFRVSQIPQKSRSLRDTAEWEIGLASSLSKSRLLPTSHPRSTTRLTPTSPSPPYQRTRSTSPVILPNFTITHRPYQLILTSLLSFVLAITRTPPVHLPSSLLDAHSLPAEFWRPAEAPSFVPAGIPESIATGNSPACDVLPLPNLLPCRHSFSSLGHSPPSTQATVQSVSWISSSTPGPPPLPNSITLAPRTPFRFARTSLQSTPVVRSTSRLWSTTRVDASEPCPPATLAHALHQTVSTPWIGPRCPSAPGAHCALLGPGLYVTSAFPVKPRRPFDSRLHSRSPQLLYLVPAILLAPEPTPALALALLSVPCPSASAPTSCWNCEFKNKLYWIMPSLDGGRGVKPSYLINVTRRTASGIGQSSLVFG